MAAKARPMSDVLSSSAIAAAHAASASLVAHTPVLSAGSISASCGGQVVVKAENLQRTGSFKIRGAMNMIADLTPAERDRGVIAASAGNHAQGVAVAARAAGIPALAALAGDGANVLDIQHRRSGSGLTFGQVEVEFLLETRNAAHADAVCEALREADFREDAGIPRRGRRFVLRG